MNTFSNERDKHIAISAFVVGFLFIFIGVIFIISGEDGVLKHLYFFVGMVLVYVGHLLNIQVKLQSQLTRIEEKIDSIVNNS